MLCHQLQLQAGGATPETKELLLPLLQPPAALAAVAVAGTGTAWLPSVGCLMRLCRPALLLLRGLPLPPRGLLLPRCVTGFWVVYSRVLGGVYHRVADMPGQAVWRGPHGFRGL